jgi:hypothetical protein
LEIPIVDNYTIIVSVIKLNPVNIDAALDSFSDSYRSFVIMSTEPSFFSEETLFCIVKNIMNHKGISIINYAKLIAKYCSNGDIVCRMGGDGGDKEISFHAFCQKKKKDLIIIQAENAL